MFTIPKGLSVWTNTCHEPLCITLIFPIIRKGNWKVPCVLQGIEISGDCVESLEGGIKVSVGRVTPLPPFVERELRQIGEDLVNWGGVILRKLLLRTTFILILPEGMVREMLSPLSFGSFPNGEEYGGRR